MKLYTTYLLPVLFLFAVVTTSCKNGSKPEKDFASPPDSARPLTWWHWLDGSVTLAGITADLEAMKRAGLGGAYLFNAGMGMPEGPARFMQPEWLALMDHALSEAKQLGLQFGVHNCDGFSQAGGPWITPETSMKKLTWTVMEVQGPAEMDVMLEQPETKENFYRDIAIVAFPAPKGTTVTAGEFTLRGSLRQPELAKLADGDPVTQANFPGTSDGNTVEFVFPGPRTVRSLVCYNANPHTWEEYYPIELEVSADGEEFNRVGEFSSDWDFTEGGRITAACGEATGRVFRLTIRNRWPVSIGEIELSEAARVHFAEAKAAWMRCRGHGAERKLHDAFPGPPRDRKLPAELTVARDAVKNISAQMNTDGRLRWSVPPGKWRILRVGFTSNGHYVSPATREGRGLECDKLDSTVVRAHLDQYVGKLKERSGRFGNALTAMEIDSWECGIQNWTTGFGERFRQSLGYDLLPFLPALIEGWIVDNADVTERALWDWRRFLADQLAENYFAVAADYAREKGLTYVGESTGRQQYLYDVAYIRNSAVPMGEMWNNTEIGQGVRVDNKVASSIAHTSGKTVVATEAYTSGREHSLWDNHPFIMKPLGDKAFCSGVNQFVFHTYAHQPYETTGPGFTFGPWGLNFNRNNTWWEQVHAWTEYLTRCQFLLRQGHSVCDVLFWVGEDVPNRIAWRDELRPALPAGYDFDGCDTHSFMEARVKDGRIVLPGGAEYRVLLLPDLTTMRPAVLKQVKSLADAGAVVLGPRPQQSPSLPDLGAGDETVRQLAGELWDGEKPRVFSGISFEQLFRYIGLDPDFAWQSATPDAGILYIHRRTADSEIYFVSNQKNRTEEITATYRVSDLSPELWDPATGETHLLPDFRLDGDRVHVPLQLDPYGSGFVVFRKKGESGEGKPAGKNWPEFASLQEIGGPWEVSFPKGPGAPESVTFDTLVSFTGRPEPGIRHFSGTAVYRKRFYLPDYEPGTLNTEIFLDLGKVEVIAEAELNGKNLGVMWKPPFRVRVDGSVRAGENHLVVHVTNLWRNRLIGDAALPDNDIQWGANARGNTYPANWPEWLLKGKPRPGGRITFCTRRDTYPESDTLSCSGLLGPVTLQKTTNQQR